MKTIMREWYLSRNWKISHLIFVLLAVTLVVMGGYRISAERTRALPASAFHLFDDVIPSAAGQNILVFSPHPDDETIAVGGYIYDAQERGAEARIILVTDGNKRGLRDTRYDEFRNAVGILGVQSSNLVFLNYPDGKMQDQDLNDLAAKFGAEIESFRPDIIFYPDPEDDHLDHATIGKGVERTLGDKISVKYSYKYLIHHAGFPYPAKYDTSSYILPPVSMISVDKEWRRFMLTPTGVVKKKEAIDFYKSQLKNPFLRGLILSSVRQNELFSVYKSTK